MLEIQVCIYKCLKRKGGSYGENVSVHETSEEYGFQAQLDSGVHTRF